MGKNNLHNFLIPLLTWWVEKYAKASINPGYDLIPIRGLGGVEMWLLLHLFSSYKLEHQLSPLEPLF